MFKKALALIMTFVMLASFMVFTASAGNTTPTRLFVGEENKSSDNLIAMYNKEKQKITVYSVNKNDEYYTVEYVKATNDYVLTFYNYKYSEPVEYGLGKYGVYCDGDLTIVINGDTQFNLNKHPEKDTPVTDACGIYVKGTLTIIGQNKETDILTVNADKRKASEPTDSIGIYAKNVIFNNVTVNANGGYAGIVANEIIAVVDSRVTSNAADDMFSAEIDPATGKKNQLFANGVVADLFVMGAVNDPSNKCYVKVGGSVDINSYILKDNYSNVNVFDAHFDVDVVVYLKDFNIIDDVRGETFNGGEKFKIIDKDLPSEIYTATNAPDYLDVSGKNAEVIDGDSWASIGIYLNCGSVPTNNPEVIPEETILTFDEDAVFCKLTVLQKIVKFIKHYILFGWLFGY